MSDFPNRLKKLRSDSKLTQKQLAEKLNVSQNAVYNWENGKREPNLDMMKKIAKVFDIALYILLDDTYPLPDTTSEAWKKRARFSGDIEMAKPPMFTVPQKDEQTKTPEYKHCVNQSTEVVQQPFEKFSETLKDSYTEYYKLLNKKGRIAADKIIEKNVRQAQEQSEEQVKLLIRIPEYVKKNAQD